MITVSQYDLTCRMPNMSIKCQDITRLSHETPSNV